MNSNVQEILLILVGSSFLTTFQILSFLSIFFLVGFSIAKMESYRNRWIRASVGMRGIYSTAIIGVPIHEMGHVIMCKLFGHHVDEIRFIQFGNPDGTMGYVNHSYNSKNLYHRIGMFFIGVAPIIMGISVITLLFWALLPSTFSEWWGDIVSADGFSEGLMASVGIIPSIFSKENVTGLPLYIFLFLSVSIASHMTLSQSDVKGARSGIIFIFLVGILINSFYAPHLKEVDFSSFLFNQFNVFMFSISLMAIGFSAFVTSLAFIVYRVRQAFLRKN